MADNITAPATGAVIATHEIGGVHYPRTKLAFGADGAATDVTTTDRLPVQTQPGLATDAKLDALIVAIGGLSPGGGGGGDASAANQLTGNTLLGEIAASLESATYYPATQPISGTVGISGSVAVTGTFWQATQPVSVASLPLPTGAATETTLTTLAGKLPTLGAKASSGSVSMTPASDATFPVSAASLPLPSGAATATKQDAQTAAIDNLASAKRWFPITPADSALAVVPDAIFVSGAGTIVARGDDGNDATFTVAAGTTLLIRPAQVRAASTATGIVGLVN